MGRHSLGSSEHRHLVMTSLNQQQHLGPSSESYRLGVVVSTSPEAIEGHPHLSGRSVIIAWGCDGASLLGAYPSSPPRAIAVSSPGVHRSTPQLHPGPQWSLMQTARHYRQGSPRHHRLESPERHRRRPTAEALMLGPPEKHRLGPRGRHRLRSTQYHSWSRSLRHRLGSSGHRHLLLRSLGQKIMAPIGASISFL